MANGAKEKGALDEFFDDLRSGGVDGKRVARFLTSCFGTDAAEDDRNNVPGFAYLQRVNTMAMRALGAQTEAMNHAWADMRLGRMDYNGAMRAYTRLTDNWVEVFMEIARGPGFVSRPSWLIFPWFTPTGGKTSDKNPDTMLVRVTIDTPVDDMLLEYTNFERFGGNETTKSLYAKNRPPSVSGTRVEIEFDRKQLDDLKVGDYVSFLFPGGRGGQAPVAIVVVRVKDK